jgi:hypothetical protein
LFVCQIYVDDIIFGSTNESTCEEFSRIMTQKFGIQTNHLGNRCKSNSLSIYPFLVIDANTNQSKYRSA